MRKWIVPNDLANSGLYLVMTHSPECKQRGQTLMMPPSGAPEVPQSTIDAVKNWIMAGAPK